MTPAAYSEPQSMLTGYLSDAASNSQASTVWAIRRITRTRRAEVARRVAPAALGNQPGMKWGQFLREYRTFCASLQAELALQILQAIPCLTGFCEAG